MGDKPTGKFRNLGSGLYVWSCKDGSKFYRFRARLAGQLVQVGLGRLESLKTARAMAADLRERLRRETLGLTGPRKGISIEEILDRWIDERSLRTVPKYHQRMKEHKKRLIQMLGDYQDATMLARDDVRNYIKARIKEGAANGTINRETSFGRSAFRAAVLDDLLPKNPFDGIPLLPEPEPHEIARVPDEATIVRILEHATPHTREWLSVLVMTLIATGERISATVALRKKNIDFVKKTVFFPAEFRKGRMGKKRARIVPLSPELAAVLAGVVAPLANDELVFQRSFRMKQGKHPVSSGMASYAWRTAAERAGVASIPRIHDLRHFAVSHLIESGMTGALTREFIGHKTEAMTRRYTHVDDSAMRRPASILGNVVGRIQGGCVNSVSMSEAIAENDQLLALH